MRSVKYGVSLKLRQRQCQADGLDLCSEPSGQPMNGAPSPKEWFTVWVRFHLSEQFQTSIVELLGDRVERV